MADNNRNWGNQSNQGWNRNRYDQDENRNRDQNYFGANYSGSAGAYNTSYGSQYEREDQRRSRDWSGRSQDQSSWYPDVDRRRRMDEMRTGGGQRGKGPKGYHRSEERIREDAYERLTDDERVDASNINIQVQGDDLILTGTVNSREEKRRAEDIVENISGVRNVENRIRVGRSDEVSGRGTVGNPMETAYINDTSNTGTTSGTASTSMSSNTTGSATSGTTSSTPISGSETTPGRRGRNK